MQVFAGPVLSHREGKAKAGAAEKQVGTTHSLIAFAKRRRRITRMQRTNAFYIQSPRLQTTEGEGFFTYRLPQLTRMLECWS